MKSAIISVIVATMLSACTSSTVNRAETGACTVKNKLDIRVMGTRRYYLLHLPQGYSPEKEMPLVIVLHGAFSTPRQMEQETCFSTLSDHHDFLVAYPSGAYGLFGFLKHWNAGHCCGKAAKENLDDVGFLLRVIEDIQKKFPVDRARIYMVGFSNGGMLTYLFAAKHPDRLAAAAVLSAAIGGKADAKTPVWIPPRPPLPLPLIVFHAKDDMNVPYHGGISPKKGGQREYLSVEKAIDFWIKNNHCRISPQTAQLRHGRITKQAWTDPVHGNDIELYTIEKWGHRWPGLYFTSHLDEDNPLKDFSFEEVIWSFFQSRPREAAGQPSR